MTDLREGPKLRWFGEGVAVVVRWSGWVPSLITECVVGFLQLQCSIFEVGRDATRSNVLVGQPRASDLELRASTAPRRLIVSTYQGLS